MEADRAEHAWRLAVRPRRSYLCPYCAKAFGDDEKAFYEHEASRACRRTKAEREAALQQAVDDYLLMERKARAWDEALRISDSSALQRSDLDFIWGLVHPAQDSSTC